MYTLPLFRPERRRRLRFPDLSEQTSRPTKRGGRDIHEYETRSRDNYRSGMHRTVVYEHLPSQAGVHFINRLPNKIKNASTPKVLKTRIKLCLASNAFYSVD
ncbi:hypothetical protein J6590_107361, partial [Homalodisca vitripennis]